MEPAVRKIVHAKKFPHLFAYDRADGHLLRSGAIIAVQYESEWYTGIVVRREEGWYMDTLELKEGMFIKLL